MRAMPGARVRAAFLEFFAQRGHLVVPSSSLVPRDDPTLLLTSAGMQQFVPYFLGNATPPSRRLTSVQKCFRTTDIDTVGNLRNLTFFEMLGNFSVGDYFKREAIAFAWELLTEVFGLPSERLYPTIHPEDDEAFDLWVPRYVPAARLTRLDDNWWGPPGLSGPCGPDSEIYLDRGEELGCGRPSCAPGCDCERYLEIWNLVFMQYFQAEDGTRTPLQQQNIDTGMGLERISAVLQGAHSVYDCDIFRPVLDHVASISGRAYGADPRTDFSLRVIADHSRATTFLVGDGVLPANEGRGYVLRRILRRAVRHARLLGLDRPILAEMAGVVIDQMGDAYPDLAARRDFVLGSLHNEEVRFLHTLHVGIELLEELLERGRARGQRTLAGEDVFRLYDTYGFPRELTEELAAEAGFTVDVAGFERAMAEQRERGRAASAFGTAQHATATVAGRSEFLGYETLEAKGEVIFAAPLNGAAGPRQGTDESWEVVLDRTPFYPEGGGQVGDRGVLRARSAGWELLVEDTQRRGEAIVHVGRLVRNGDGPHLLPEGGRTPTTGQQVVAQVDKALRDETRRNHTATHLLHKALKVVLGPHVEQAGSLVAPDRLRFDYAHVGAPTPEQLRQVIAWVNHQIRENQAVYTDVVPYAEGLKMGAVAIFEEKYGDLVRVVSAGEESKELCGGTHVRALGDIGFFWILSEGSIGSGLRRIEAVTGKRAEDEVGRRLALLEAAASRLQVPAQEVPREVERLNDEVRSLRRELARARQAAGAGAAERLLGRAATTAKGITVLAARVDADSPDSMRKLGDWLRHKLGSAVVVLASVLQEKPLLVAMVTPDLVARGVHAGNLVKRLAAEVGGGGGGRPDVAQAGGRDASKLDHALGLIPGLIDQTVS